MTSLLNIISIVATFVVVVGSASLFIEFLITRLLGDANGLLLKRVKSNSNIRFLIIVLIIAILAFAFLDFYRPT